MRLPAPSLVLLELLMSSESLGERPVEASPTPDAFESDLMSLSLSSVALARLVDEVRNDDTSASRAYDRVHNRHNR